MDPNLFHVDWARLFEVVGAIIVLAFMLERALALLFEHRWFVERFDRSGVKEPIAFLVAAVICVKWQFDAVSMIVLTDHVTFSGELITAAVIAGGSKGAVKFFRDVLNIKSRAVVEADRTRQQIPPQ